MKTLMQRFGAALLAGAFLGLAGCESSNESEAERLQKNLGPPPTSDVKGKTDIPPPPKSMQELAERRKQQLAEDPSKSEYGKAQRSGGGGRGR